MAPIKKQGDQPTRFGQVWFYDRYLQMKNPQLAQFEKIQMIFEHLLQRIEWLEKEVDALKLKP